MDDLVNKICIGTISCRFSLIKVMQLAMTLSSGVDPKGSTGGT